MGQTSFPPNAIIVTSAGLIGASASGSASTLSAAAARTLLSVSSTAEIAAAYQPIDATLAALAGVTTAADKVIYATGADTFSTTTLTSFGRSLIDDADASAARTTLGLGTMATQASTSYAALAGATFTGAVSLGNQAFTAGSAVIDATVSGQHALTLKATGAAAAIRVLDSSNVTKWSIDSSGSVTIGALGYISFPHTTQIGDPQQIISAGGAGFGIRTAGTFYVATGGAGEKLSVDSTGVATFSAQVSIGPYTFATLPSASANSGKCLRITDRGQKLAYSDGTNWLFVHDNSTVS